MTVFQAGNILVPEEKYLNQWAVIACDQYTSQPEYWERVKQNVGDAPSTLQMILPEAQLGQGNQEKIERIHNTMSEYCTLPILRCFPHSFVYVERTMSNGAIRRGVVGVIDLEHYEYTDKSSASIRATEKTVLERIPPRKAVRQDSQLDMSHVILLADDPKDSILGYLESSRNKLPHLYDFDLMEEGGHISGWLVEKEFAAMLEDRITRYEQERKQQCEQLGCSALCYAVGDGNHSLASAKACYEKLRMEKSAEELQDSPLRYALVELENIRDEVQDFEPIHRIISVEQLEEFLNLMNQQCGASDGYPVKWYAGNQTGCIYLDRDKGKSAVSIVQNFLDQNLQDTAKQLDYIHGEDVVQSLAKKSHKLGLVLPAIPNEHFFEDLVVDGVLPRKTFSVGHAQEKRFYLETRKLF